MSSTTPTDRQGQNDLVRRFREARRANTPLISIATPDQFATVRLLAKNGNGGSTPTPKITWNLADGFAPVNFGDELSIRAIAEATGGKPSADPNAAMTMAVKMPEQTILFFHNAQRFIAESVSGSIQLVQRISNLRDKWKVDRRTLVLLGPNVPLPPELANDVIELDEPLPGESELKMICRYQADEWEDKMEWEVTDDLLTRAAAALKGCSAFGAEQLFSMAVRKTGIDFSDLNRSVEKVIEQTKGLSYETGTETFDDIGGLEFAKTFGRRLFAGPRRPSLVVRIEELEKVMGGAAGDLSGTSQDALQVLLSEMEDRGYSGLLSVGCPGAGKSLFSKSLANTFGVRPLRLDVNATRGSLVGQSGQQIRAAMKIINTIGGRDVFFVASVNRLDSIPPELQRRFRFGIWFFDVPSDRDRAAIWAIQRHKFQIADDDETPDERDLTGADIRNICETAYSLGCSLREALDYVVPLKVQSPDAIEAARKQAVGRFLNANIGGVYQMPSVAGRRGARKIQAEE